MKFSLRIITKFMDWLMKIMDSLIPKLYQVNIDAIFHKENGKWVKFVKEDSNE